MNIDYTRTVNVGDIQFIIKYSNKALLNYLNRLETDSEGIDSLYNYFYDLALNGARSSNIEFAYSRDQFIELIDSIPDSITNFQIAVSSFKGEENKKKG